MAGLLAASSIPNSSDSSSVSESVLRCRVADSCKGAQIPHFNTASSNREKRNSCRVCVCGGLDTLTIASKTRSVKPASYSTYRTGAVRRGCAHLVSD